MSIGSNDSKGLPVVGENDAFRPDIGLLEADKGPIGIGGVAVLDGPFDTVSIPPGRNQPLSREQADYLNARYREMTYQR
jgi:hypothetical protein